MSVGLNLSQLYEDAYAQLYTLFEKDASCVDRGHEVFTAILENMSHQTQRPQFQGARVLGEQNRD